MAWSDLPTRERIISAASALFYNDGIRGVSAEGLRVGHRPKRLQGNRFASQREGRELHHRFAPRVHHFQHDLFMFWLDLDELPALTRKLWLFSQDRWNLYQF